MGEEFLRRELELVLSQSKGLARVGVELFGAGELFGRLVQFVALAEFEA